MPKQALSKSEVNKWNRVNKRLIADDQNATIRRQVENVISNIRTINERRVAASIALCWYYSEKAKQTFRKFQTFNTFWTNQTFTAYSSVFTGIIAEPSEIGFFIAHMVEYGVYLELANDRKHEALWPIIRDLQSQFEIDLHEIWSE